MSILKAKKKKRAYAVFEGGGVKGIGIAGALEVAEMHYQWERVAGTSAGSIIAALVAANYSAEEIKKLILSIDFSLWRDKYPPSEVPIAGPAYSFLANLGVYQGKFIEEWLAEKLAAKNIAKFGDLICEGEDTLKYRLQVIASDISRGRMVVLPGDLKHYGIEPENFSVAKAVRMSCAIPFFFSPVVLKYKDEFGVENSSYFVDGGILSNYPLWLFEERNQGRKYPTIGFRLVAPNEGRPRAIRGPVSFMSALISTMMEAHDTKYLEERTSAKTISIPTLGISATDFDISDKRKMELYNAGRDASEAFFAKRSFKYYIQRILGPKSEAT